PNRAGVYRSGIDCEKFRFRQSLHSSSGPIRIVSVGRLVEKKGVEYSVKAVLNLIKEGYDIEYVIIGGGPLYAQLSSLIHENNMTSRIKLLGPKDQEFIIDALETSHIFISSSVTAQDGDQNGPDNTIKEAMAVGLPVVACQSGAIEEVVINDMTGLLVEERNIVALASKIKYLIDTPSIWPNLTKTARKFVETNYNLKSLTAELIERYQSVLN
ncbi:MAG: glycosyltransferase, partial [Candidatus Omnitrophica bacterium]|nr:glycosyltransferase [Candidatus Omnitrophota bacterium]